MVAATNRDLEAEIRAGRFREDLYYRLNVVEIRIPPLRERRDEIPALVDHFLQVGQRAVRPRRRHLAVDACSCLVEHAWPGNIRELENSSSASSCWATPDQIRQELACAREGRAAVASPVEPRRPLAAAAADDRVDLKAIARQAARDAERIVIAETLDRVHWNRAKAARILQISYKALLYKIVDCGLAPKTRRGAARGAGRLIDTAPACRGGCERPGGLGGARSPRLRSSVVTRRSSRRCA